jgi:transcriptional regulator with XRE-family HTH domain
MELKPYIANELTRIEALKELIGEEDPGDFAAKFNLTYEGIAKYLSGALPLTKKSGRILTTRLNLPYDYFELARPGTTNKYNSTQSTDELIPVTHVTKKWAKPRVFRRPKREKEVVVDISSDNRSEYILNSLLSGRHQIGRRLKDERIRLGFAISRFSSLMSVDGKTQLRYESGAEDIPAEYLRLAELSHKVDVLYVLSAKRQVILTSHQELIGARLKIERLRCKMSEYEFADALSTSLSTQILYESGAESIPSRYLSLAALILKVDVVYILTSNRVYRGQ